MRPLVLIILIISCSSALAAQVDADVYISRHAAKILPHSIVTLTSPEAGELRIISAEEDKVNAGTQLALINEEKLLMDERETEHNIRLQRHERDKTVLSLCRQKEELEFIQKLPPERRAFTQERLKTTVDVRVLASLDEAIAITKERFSLAEEQMRKTVRKKRETATLSMPFNGRIQYHVPLPKDSEKSITIPANTPIATVIDDSAYYVVLAATDPKWAKLEHERLLLVVDLGGGEQLKAHWHHQKVDKGDRGETLFYYFILSEADKDKAFSLLGANIVAELFYHRDSDWVYISKAELAKEAGSRAIETWEELVDALRPGHSIVFIGETHLCLRKTDER